MVHSKFQLDFPHRKCTGSNLTSPQYSHPEILLHWHWNSEWDYYKQYLSEEYHSKTTPIPHIERYDEHLTAGRARAGYLSGALARRGLSLGRVCSIGAGTGSEVVALSEAGGEVAGLEPSRPICDWAYNVKNIPLICGSWVDWNWEVNLTVSTDVIEHLTRPFEFLLKAHSLSEFLYLETPEWEQDLDLNWRHVRPLEHICLYSRGALKELCKLAGWKVIDIFNPVSSKLSLLLQRKS